MEKIRIEKSNRGIIELEYNPEQFSIEHIRNKNIIILRRLSDNVVLEVFNDNVGFIVQNNTNDQINFLVSEYREDERYLKFKHYVAEKWSDQLLLKNEFNCSSVWLDEHRITDSSFIVEDSYYGGRIYNLEQISDSFHRIYNDKKLNKYFSEKTLMVSKKIGTGSEFVDTITYGINPETFQIVTPIWSELQQRFIKVYTKQQAEELNEKLKKIGQEINFRHSLDEITIYFEIERYLQLLPKYLEGPKQIYLDHMDSMVNEGFIKHFVNK